MTEKQKNALEYKTPDKHTFEEFKTGCFLVPLTADFNFDKWKGNGAKVNRENLMAFIREGVIKHNPHATKKQVEKILDETIDNFIGSVKGFLSPLNPCVAIAYPLNNIWLITFFTEVFNPKKKNGEMKKVIESSSLVEGMDLTEVALTEIEVLNFDPYFYSYTIMKRAQEQDAMQEVLEKSQEERERLTQLENQ